MLGGVRVRRVLVQAFALAGRLLLASSSLSSSFHCEEADCEEMINHMNSVLTMQKLQLKLAVTLMMTIGIGSGDFDDEYWDKLSGEFDD